MSWMGHKNESTTWKYLRYLKRKEALKVKFGILDSIMHEALEAKHNILADFNRFLVKHFPSTNALKQGQLFKDADRAGIFKLKFDLTKLSQKGAVTRVCMAISSVYRNTFNGVTRVIYMPLLNHQLKVI